MGGPGLWVIGTPPFEAGLYQMLCLNTPYHEFLKEHTAEVLETFPVDGLFFDIVWPIACACRYCREKMVIPLFKVKVRVKAPAPVCQVAAVPEEASLTFRTEDPYAVFELGRIDGHAIVSLTFA
jgi:hypothetical protein